MTHLAGNHSVKRLLVSGDGEVDQTTQQFEFLERRRVLLRQKDVAAQPLLKEAVQMIAQWRFAIVFREFRQPIPYVSPAPSHTSRKSRATSAARLPFLSVTGMRNIEWIRAS
jgi:hypothetical protein